MPGYCFSQTYKAPSADLPDGSALTGNYSDNISKGICCAEHTKLALDVRYTPKAANNVLMVMVYGNLIDQAAANYIPISMIVQGADSATIHPDYYFKYEAAAADVGSEKKLHIGEIPISEFRFLKVAVKEVNEDYEPGGYDPETYDYGYFDGIPGSDHGEVTINLVMTNR